jgi:hypothetical protein
VHHSGGPTPAKRGDVISNTPRHISYLSLSLSDLTLLG